MVSPVASRRFVRLTLAVLVGVCVFAGVVTAIGHDPVSLAPGLVEGPTNGTTLVSVQGFHFQGEGNKQKPARLAAGGPNGDLQWRYKPRGDTEWFYDIDPLPNGNLLVTSTAPGATVLFEYDRANETRVWERRFDIEDTHDADMIDDDELVVANMREYENGTSHDRLFVYNLTTDEVTWEWTFHEHVANDTDGGFSADWTHVNDVDPVGDDAFLVSPRNFDQVLLIDRETKAITDRLGRDGDHDVLNEQHNPDLLQRQAPMTILVADSENDRVVEYARTNGTWTATWTLTGLNWPRDADRLPNGNTLVTDTLNHRVVEVTPAGEVVWEFYAPWAPYDSERLGTGDESQGPTMRQLNTTGTVPVNGTAGAGPAGATTPADVIGTVGDGTPIENGTAWAARGWSHVTPFLRPVWLSRWAFAAFSLGTVIAAVWGGAELFLARRHVLARCQTVRRWLRTLRHRE
jgi:hypothetical protein